MYQLHQVVSFFEHFRQNMAFLTRSELVLFTWLLDLVLVILQILSFLNSLPRKRNLKRG